MRILPEEDLAAAHCAPKWAQKFAILWNYLASQVEDAKIELRIFENGRNPPTLR
jgi:hypothetical protein